MYARTGLELIIKIIIAIIYVVITIILFVNHDQAFEITPLLIYTTARILGLRSASANFE